MLAVKTGIVTFPKFKNSHKFEKHWNNLAGGKIGMSDWQMEPQNAVRLEERLALGCQQKWTIMED